MAILFSAGFFHLSAFVRISVTIHNSHRKPYIRVFFAPIFFVLLNSSFSITFIFTYLPRIDWSFCGFVPMVSIVPLPTCILYVSAVNFIQFFVVFVGVRLAVLCRRKRNEPTHFVDSLCDIQFILMEICNIYTLNERSNSMKKYLMWSKKFAFSTACFRYFLLFYCRHSFVCCLLNALSARAT